MTLLPSTNSTPPSVSLPPLTSPAAEGHIVLFDREAPFELRLQNAKNAPQEVGSLEAIRVKVMVLGGQERNQVAEVRIELTSENDLFFHYTHSVDMDRFR